MPPAAAHHLSVMNMMPCRLGEDSYILTSAKRILPKFATKFEATDMSKLSAHYQSLLHVKDPDSARTSTANSPLRNYGQEIAEKVPGSFHYIKGRERERELLPILAIMPNRRALSGEACPLTNGVRSLLAVFRLSQYSPPHPCQPAPSHSPLYRPLVNSPLTSTPSTSLLVVAPKTTLYQPHNSNAVLHHPLSCCFGSRLPGYLPD
jgi:hypothetical protein